MGMKITMRPVREVPRKRTTAKPQPKPSSTEPCFHTISPRLEGKIMKARLRQRRKDNRIFRDIGFISGEPPADNPDAPMVAFTWLGNDKIVLTEALYEYEIE
jgi:hypothetical protein